VANQGANDISAFFIDAASGALTSIGGSPFAANGGAPMAVAVDPSGTFLYVVNNTSNNVRYSPIDDATGVLFPVVRSYPPATVRGHRHRSYESLYVCRQLGRQ